MTPLDGALKIAALGLPVFPIVAGGKRPALSQWQEAATTDAERIKTWTNCNYGVALKDHTVIDFDCKAGADGLRNFIAKYNRPLEKTLIVRTPSGGMHLYYLGATCNSVSRLAEGVDTRSIGGYVLAPGSVVEGKRYVADFTKAITPLPRWVAEALRANKEPLARPKDELARGYITSGERNNELARWAGVLRGQGLTRDEIRVALQAVNQYRCEEPLPTEEVLHIADSISAKPFTVAKALVDFTPAEAKKEATEQPPKAISEFTGEPPERRWLIPGWLPEGETVSLYGAGSTGKSLLSVQLGLALATGGAWLGNACAQTPVLYVACEDTDDELHIRCSQILSQPEYEFSPEVLENAPLFLWSRVGKENDIAMTSGSDVEEGRFYQVLDAAFENLAWKRGLLILDTVADVYLGSEIDRSSVNKFIKTIIGKFKAKYGLTVLLLAHPSRAGTALKDGLSGSTAWDAAVRCRWWLHRDENNPDYSILKRVKSNYSSVGDEIVLEWNQGCFRAVDAPVDPLVETLFLALQDSEERSLYRLSQLMFELCPLLGSSPRAVERKVETRLLRDKRIVYNGLVARMERVKQKGREVKRFVLEKEDEIYD